jgi:hypothetical protein
VTIPGFVPRTAPVATSGNGSNTPIRILVIVAVLLTAFVIFAPQSGDDAGTAFSSYSAGPDGARAIYDVVGRLGFVVSRDTRSLVAPPDTASVFVFIQPAQPLSATEQTSLLGAVRRGTILLFTPGGGSLSDSLGFSLVVPSGGFYTLSQTTVTGGAPPEPDVQDPRIALQTVTPISIALKATSKSDNQSFLWLGSKSDSGSAPNDSASEPALVMGHHFGRGYVIGVAPAVILTNRLARDPRTAIAIVRALQYAHMATGLQPRSNSVVFDEYHHGFGVHADVAAAVQRALTDTPLGRMTIEIVAAALVLMLAFAVRPIAPVSAPPLSRRSPLEHVEALAHAYLQVDARSLGASRLIRGLRRRHSLGLPGSVPDTMYLSTLRDRLPVVSADVDRILASVAPDSSASSDRLAVAGAAVANIERAFTE